MNNITKLQEKNRQIVRLSDKTEEQLTDDMIRSANILLCGTNATRERLTKLVREEILGFRGTLPNYGEKVICRQNDFNNCIDGIGLGNGLTGIVTEPPDISEFDGKTFKMSFKPDLFNGTFEDIASKAVSDVDLFAYWLEVRRMLAFFVLLD